MFIYFRKETDHLKRMGAFSCNLSALDQEQRKRHDILAKDLFLKHLEVRELPDGYGFRFPNDRSLFTALSEGYSATALLSLPYTHLRIGA